MSKKSIKDYLNVAQLEKHEPKHAEDNPRKLKQTMVHVCGIHKKFAGNLLLQNRSSIFFSMTIKTVEIFRTTENK